MSESVGSGTAAEPRGPMATAVVAATACSSSRQHGGRIPVWWIGPLLQLVLLGS